ncbi:MBL fold metallo-hydrolase [Caldisalinibacter kiritimatiensis]|uniref:Hydroxyacylglutathione hydrolase n=1 Tax=Caldisalinibacter kiritimatiensis TaxID=1304284 RepID=R1CPQ6_9FIRM|nr:MBL fold metallo-hydrolase [Caldisalinibacter kiritimatiensis]EOD00656.1 Hydroxyacylglutathione hydrolase [Caldisalinibacter kiritimatiensis]
MIIERLPLGVYAANCYIIGCESTREGIIVDPGGDAENIVKTLEEFKIKPKYIILTHGHGDHIGGLPKLKKELSIPVLIHKEDEEMLKDADKNLSSMMSIENIEIVPDKTLKDGDIINIGEHKAQIIHTPGHTKGSICIKLDDIILSGDTLFAGSIGRTDFPGGSFEEIISSIKNKILVYDDKVKILPGHGPATTVEYEKNNNPFI